MVREAAVSAIETTAKSANGIARLSIPRKPANAAASAPMPNQSSTKPVVKISATMSIAPRMHQSIQIQSIDSALRQILHHEPHIRRAFREPAHEVRIPVFPIRHIDSDLVTIACELSLEVAPDTVEHLKLKLIF